MSNNNCKDCFYYRTVYQPLRCCHYLLWTGKKRPCDPGKDCTVKVKIRNYKNKGIKSGL